MTVAGRSERRALLGLAILPSNARRSVAANRIGMVEASYYGYRAPWCWRIQAIALDSP